MNIPKITGEAVDAAAKEAVRVGRLYDWIAENQPELTRVADVLGKQDEALSGQIVAGMVLTLRALSHMPDKTPPDDAQTSQDRLFTREQVERAFGRTVLDYPANKQDEEWQANEYPKLLSYFLGRLEDRE